MYLKPLFWFISRILGPILFACFLEHLFSPIVGRSEEPDTRLPVLGSQYLVSYSFWVIYEGHLESKERFAIQRYLSIIGKKKNMQVL